MNIKSWRFLLLLVLLSMLSACGTTPPSDYYLLSAETASIPSGESPSLGVGPVDIPQYLNRNSFVYNREGNKLHISRFERWAEPLDDGIVRIIRLDLASLLNTENVQAYPWSNSEEPEYGVDLTILELDANSSMAQLVVEWHLHRPQSNETIVRRISVLEQPLILDAPVTAADVAPAYSALFEQLSKIISAEISSDIKIKESQ